MVLALLTLSGSGCRPSPEGPRVLRLTQHPAGTRGIRLNEPIQFLFSAPIEASSVTAHSARIERASDGRLAEGSWVVDGASLVFEPRSPTLPTLRDAGFQPATLYEVVVVGFPEPDGIRARDGAPLERTFRSSIETVGAGGLDAEGGAERAPTALFWDPTPYAHRLRLESYELDPAGALTFLCDEPLDPRTLRPGDFEIRLKLEEGRAEGAPGAKWGPPIKVSAELVENGRGRGGARLEVRKPMGWLPERTYRLSLPMPPEFGLRDLGGHPVQVENLARTQDFLEFVTEDWGATRRSQWLREEFQTSVYRSNRTVAGTDGTAYWGNDSVSIRYPKAVGSGRDGDAVLGEDEDRKDIHAVTLELREGTRCALAPGGGPTVLRTQGSMRIDGVLSRRAREVPVLGPGGEPVLDASQRPLLERKPEVLVFKNEDDPHGEWNPADPNPDRAAPDRNAEAIPESVSEFIERARRLERDWTILVVGGDLWLNGRFEIEGGLLIVLGGRLRSSGSLGSDFLAHTVVLGLNSRGVGGRGAEDLGLWMDPPEINPLVRPMRFGVYSKPLPPEGGVRRWKPHRVVGRRGGGDFVIHFEGEPTEAHPAPWIESHPTFLHGSPTLQFQLELTLPAGDGRAPWDPPAVDAVEIHWDSDS